MSITPRSVSACLVVSNLDASIDWYGAHFGFHVERRAAFPAANCRLAFLRQGEFLVELVEPASISGAPRPDPLRHIASRGVSQLVFHVADVAAAFDYARGAGLVLATRLLDVPDFRLRAFMVRDPDGTLIEVIQFTQPFNPEVSHHAAG
jgi:catechol 2,3-dioxygenase-like lactoylglutathione lyase family enzyme